MLLTVEGIDGAGKTALAQALHGVLGDRGVEVELLREPGGVVAAERVRDLVKDPDLTVGTRMEALLFAAARAQLVEERLEPLLEEGRWVLLDRFVDSSLAYQGAGRGLGVTEVAALNAFATAGIRPDRTLLLRLDPREALARQDHRGEVQDRLEREGVRFLSAVARAYDDLAAAEPGRFRLLDASRSREDVLEQALEALADLLPA